MAKNNWNGLMRILELRHFDENGNLLDEQFDLPNQLHQDGQDFLLRAAFTGGRVSNVIPDYYYLGLDNRQSVAAADTIDSLIGEPIGSGYQRQQVSSNGDFSVNFDGTNYLATSPIVAFQATIGNWGPVSNLFLTDRSDNTGSLISTVILQSPISVNSGNSVTMRIGLQILQC